MLMERDLEEGLATPARLVGDRMKIAIEVRGLYVSYSGNLVLKGVDLTIPEGKVTAIIGPSGCGKTTLLRCLNRLGENTPGCEIRGEVFLKGQDILHMDPMLLRRRTGMVFQRPNPFPASIRENVLYGVKATGRFKKDHDALVRTSLERAAIWDEVRHRLKDSAYGLSLGQQQRICIARSLAMSPEIILMDEPASALDPASSSRLEDSILSMKGEYTVVIVTHNMQQALRVSDYSAFLYKGELIEFGATRLLFQDPLKEETRAYVAGRFG